MAAISMKNQSKTGAKHIEEEALLHMRQSSATQNRHTNLIEEGRKDIDKQERE